MLFPVNGWFRSLGRGGETRAGEPFTDSASEGTTGATAISCMRFNFMNFWQRYKT
jgi:hypothetical protein